MVFVVSLKGYLLPVKDLNRALFWNSHRNSPLHESGGTSLKVRSAARATGQHVVPSTAALTRRSAPHLAAHADALVARHPRRSLLTSQRGPAGDPVTVLLSLTR